MRRLWLALVLVLLPVVACAGQGALDETWWEWLVRLLVQAANGWWQGA